MNTTINTMFFLSRKKDIITNEQEQEILKIWNTKEEDKENQSYFTTPIIIKI